MPNPLPPNPPLASPPVEEDPDPNPLIAFASKPGCTRT